MPLFYEDPKKLQKMQQELFLMFEQHVFPVIQKELPTEYTIEKYFFGMWDIKSKAFVKSSVAKSLFGRTQSNKAISILMNHDMECSDQKKALKAMNVAVMGHG